MKHEGLAVLFGGKPMGDDDSSSEGEEIARDILDAIKDDDPKALWLALQHAHEACASEPDKDDAEE
jgi:hypothetical protein